MKCADFCDNTDMEVSVTKSDPIEDREKWVDVGVKIVLGTIGFSAISAGILLINEVIQKYAN